MTHGSPEDPIDEAKRLLALFLEAQELNEADVKRFP
jgi:hypothetical protein